PKAYESSALPLSYSGRPTASTLPYGLASVQVRTPARGAVIPSFVESGRGQPHSTTLRGICCASRLREVVECGCPAAFASTKFRRPTLLIARLQRLTSRCPDRGKKRAKPARRRRSQEVLSIYGCLKYLNGFAELCYC